MASAKDNLKIKTNTTMAQLVQMYADLEKSANNDPTNRGGSNDLSSKFENAVGRYADQSGEKFDVVWNRVKKAYSDQTKQGRGSAGKTGMTPVRPEYS